jgi:putative ABC transport system substrate-binding protein
MIGRRTFVQAVAASFLSLPRASDAQSTGNVVPRIGVLVWGECPGTDFDYYQALRELGYVERRTMINVCQSAARRYEDLVAAAKRLVALNPNVIVALNHPTAKAAVEATKQIPIVMIASGDPVASGLVSNLARPGGNVTGLSYYATELSAKRLEMLTLVKPVIRNVGVLNNPAVSYLPFLADTKVAAKALQLELHVADVSGSEDLSRAFSAFAKRKVEGVVVLPDLLLSAEAEQIARLALAHRLPTVAWGRWFATAGCLITYSAEYPAMVRRAAV